MPGPAARQVAVGGVPVIYLGGWHVRDAAGQSVPGIIEADTAE